MKKTLVTGSNGFLGVAVVERLLSNNTSGVVCMVRPGSDTRRLDAVLHRYPDSGARTVAGSLGTLRDAQTVIDAALDGGSNPSDGADELGTIIHLAAAMRGPPADIFSGTVVCSQNLLEATLSRRMRPRVLLTSSFGVYGVADLPRGHVVDESTPVEPHPERRDSYSHAKLRQEELFFNYHRKHQIPLTVLRPGAIYGPHGGAFSGRVGVQFPGFFLFLGGRNVLPLLYADNCAEAIRIALRNARFDGDIYNVVDDDLIGCDEYMRRYRKKVVRLHVFPMPYFAALAMSYAVEWYHRASRGQLPPIFTPYKTRSMWKGNRFSNAKIRSLGFRPIVSTERGLSNTFEHLRAVAARSMKEASGPNVA